MNNNIKISAILSVEEIKELCLKPTAKKENQTGLTYFPFYDDEIIFQDSIQKNRR
jgi:hypothetical protein